MQTLLSALSILFLSSLVTFSLYLIGTSIIGFKFAENSSDRGFTSLILGMSFIIVFTYVGSKLGIGLNKSIKIIILLVIPIIFLRIMQIFIWKPEKRKKLVDEIISQILNHILASCIAIFSIIFPLRYFTRYEKMIPILSLGNNDAGSYLAQATAINRSGFAGEGFIQNADYFKFTGVRDFGGPSLITYVSNLLNIEIWASFTVCLMAIVALIFLACRQLLKALYIIRQSHSIIASSFLVLNPITFYLVGHNFLTQLIAIFSWIALLYGILKVFSKNLVISEQVIVITSASLIALYSYPHMGLIHILIIIGSGIACLPHFIFLRYIKKLQLSSTFDNRRALKAIVISLLLSLALALPFLLIAINLLYERSRDKVGWSLAGPVTFANLFVTGNFSDNALTPVWILLSIFLLFYIFTQLNKYLFGQFEKNEIGLNFKYFRLMILFNLFFSPIIIFFVLSIVYGPESYRSWKFAFSFLPLLLQFFILKIEKNRKVNLRYITILPLTLIFINSNYNSWLPVLNSPLSHQNHATSVDLYSLNTLTKSLQLESLNINLSPYFETMIATTIVESKRVFMNSATYDLEMVDNSTCTLVRNNDLRYENVKSITLNSTYKIVMVPSECKNQ